MDRGKWFWLNNIEGIGIAKIRELLNNFQDAENIYDLTKEDLWGHMYLSEQDKENLLSEAIKDKAAQKFEKLLASNVKCIFPFDAEYPGRLLELYDKPNILYYVGRIPPADRRSVAIVGSRNCSYYGESIARELAGLLAKHGVNVISGLAKGIDRSAHEGTVFMGGYTGAVLAGGPDKCYPKQNYNLYMDILQSGGGIMSEYGPGEATLPGMFPIRNRIISGLCEAVIVVEAGHKSGSLITANYALEQNRRILAVPGRIGDAGCEGSNELIAQGAETITSYEQFLELMELTETESGKKVSTNLTLANNEKVLYSLLLDFAPKSLETLSEESELPYSDVFEGLIGLEVRGLIKEIGKNFYVRIG